jgi:hypothetical protein
MKLTGKRFGLLTVTGLGVIKIRRGVYLWECKCDCGTKTTPRQGNLLRGCTRSCGCIAKPHGRHRSNEYASWRAMRNRCNNTKSKDFHRYGGRGIGICERWEDFRNFYADMGERPADNYSLERIDVNGNYEPSNCRWATPAEQGVNRRNNKYYTLNGVTLTAMQWSKRTGIPRGTISRRLHSGWSVEDALTTPNIRGQRVIKKRAELRSLGDFTNPIFY